MADSGFKLGTKRLALFLDKWIGVMRIRDYRELYAFDRSCRPVSCCLWFDGIIILYVKFLDLLEMFSKILLRLRGKRFLFGSCMIK